MIEFILGISVLLNITVGWYIIKLLRKLIEIEDGFDDIRTKLIEFATHLKAINKVESFYGDPTITSLVKHMKRLAGDIEEYARVMVVFEDDMEENNDDTNEKEA